MKMEHGQLALNYIIIKGRGLLVRKVRSGHSDTGMCKVGLYMVSISSLVVPCTRSRNKVFRDPRKRGRLWGRLEIMFHYFNRPLAWKYFTRELLPGGTNYSRLYHIITN